MSARGFTLVELLVATLVTVLIVAATLLVVDATRTTFLVAPATVDIAHRAREAAERLTSVLKAAGGAGVGDTTRPGSIAALVPHVWPLPPFEDPSAPRFGAFWVLDAVDRTAARVAVDQSGPGGSLTLDPASPCAATADVCGIAPDEVVMVVDARGRFDIFEVGEVWPSLMRVTPLAPLGRAYQQGSWVVKVRADRYGLVAQGDGSLALTRITWAGARQPLVDGVTHLDITVWGVPLPPALADGEGTTGLASYGLPPPPAGEVDVDGIWPVGEHCLVRRAAGLPESTLETMGAAPALVRLDPPILNDGPWCPHAFWPSAFDADLFRVRRIDVRVRVEAQSAMLRGPAGLLFSRGGTSRTSPLRWVRDREFEFGVALRER
jgi:hypothetical protein